VGLTAAAGVGEQVVGVTVTDRWPPSRVARVWCGSPFDRHVWIARINCKSYFTKKNETEPALGFR
jgi:hypothetical protein